MSGIEPSASSLLQPLDQLHTKIEEVTEKYGFTVPDRGNLDDPTLNGGQESRTTLAPITNS